MKRRALLAAVAATASLAGCSGNDGSPTDTSTGTPTRTPTETPTESPTETATESPTEAETESPTETEPLKEPGTRSAEDLPPACPVSTLDEFEPPDEITEERVVEFAREYEVAYILDMFTAPDDHDLYVERRAVERRYYGYAVDVYLTGGVNVLYGRVRAEAIPSDREPPSATNLENERLRELVEKATENHGEVTASWRHGSVEYRGVVISRSARRDFEALPRDDGAYYVDVGGETVRLRLEDGPYATYDFWRHTRYYIDSRVARRVDNPSRSEPETPAREGELLECQ